MLLELEIHDFAIIDDLRILFEPGLNALTGETGAGKSIIIDALGSVLGERVGPDVVRSGARAALVDATFDLHAARDVPGLRDLLEELGIDPNDDHLILGREIGANGRSAARLNGRPVTASTLSRVGALLVDIHGQSDHLSLLRPGEQLLILDRYAGVTADRIALAALVHDLRETRSRLDAVTAGERDRAQRIDLLTYQVNEIDAAALEPGEEEQLVSERARLANAEHLALQFAAALAALAGSDDGDLPGAAGSLRLAARELSGAAGLDPGGAGMASRAEEALLAIEDLATDVRAWAEDIQASPARLEEVNERLQLLKSLQRKYGATVEEIIAFRDRAAIDLAALTGTDHDPAELQAQVEALLSRVGDAASALSAARRTAADRLARETVQAIADLNMGSSHFEVAIQQLAAHDGAPFAGQGRVAFDETGADRVEFLLAANTGEALKPLARVASGGETARLMLALKSILSAADHTPTLVFDEVDVGVGGRSGQVVGEKLWGLATDHQVIVITHLPQIAAFAGAHFRIAKGEADGRTVSRVDRLEGAERIDELAAMVDGEPATDASRATAREMLDRVAQVTATPRA